MQAQVGVDPHSFGSGLQLDGGEHVPASGRGSPPHPGVAQTWFAEQVVLPHGVVAVLPPLPVVPPLPPLALLPPLPFVDPDELQAAHTLSTQPSAIVATKVLRMITIPPLEY